MNLFVLLLMLFQVPRKDVPDKESHLFELPKKVSPALAYSEKPVHCYQATLTDPDGKEAGWTVTCLYVEGK
jgi:hypothetical protein